MPKKHTAEDDAFVREFSTQLRVAYDKARMDGTNRTEFATSIGVGNAVLQDLLNGKSMPGVRSLALAVDKYDIDVTYQGTRFRARKTGLTRVSKGRQLTFPFVLSALHPQVALKLGPVTENTITLGIQVKAVG
jgi:hypothetical protein